MVFWVYDPGRIFWSYDLGEFWALEPVARFVALLWIAGPNMAKLVRKKTQPWSFSVLVVGDLF